VTKSVADDIVDCCKTVVGLEDKFIDLAFSAGEVQGMTPEDIKAYIRFIADWRLRQLGLPEVYQAKENPLPWLQSMLSGWSTPTSSKPGPRNIPRRPPRVSGMARTASGPNSTSSWPSGPSLTPWRSTRLLSPRPWLVGRHRNRRPPNPRHRHQGRHAVLGRRVGRKQIVGPGAGQRVDDEHVAGRRVAFSVHVRDLPGIGLDLQQGVGQGLGVV